MINLTYESFQFLKWLLKATRRLMEVDRSMTIKTIFSTTLSDILTVLVFFLPLKVILLVGSDGIPKYFQFFITESTRTYWILGLSAGIFCLYGLTLTLDSLVQNWTARGADTLTKLADRVPIASDESAVTESSFHRICETTAKIIFLAIMLATGLLLYTPLFLVVSILLCTELVLAAFLSGDLDQLPGTKAARLVREDTGRFLGFLKSINFLVLFVFLVAAFVFSGGPNVLVAIASIMVGRQIFNSSVAIIKAAQKLHRERAQVDTLLFTDVQLAEGEGIEERELRRRYSVSTRADRLRSLASQGSTTGGDWSAEGNWSGSLPDADARRLREIIDCVWLDSGRPTVAMFDLYFSAGSDETKRVYREVVYTRKAAKGLERHDYLLRHLDSFKFQGVRTVYGTTEGPFVIRILDLEDLVEVDRRTFRAGHDELIQDLAALEIPRSLSKANERAHPPLGERVRRTIVKQLDIVADEPWARDASREFNEQLEPLIARVQQLPQVLINPNLNPRNALARSDGKLRLVDWRSWRLEPTGADFNPQRDSSQLLVRIAAAVRQRSDATASLELSDLLCASLMRWMESFAIQGRPKEALRLAHDTLPLLWLPDGDLIAALDDTRNANERSQADDEGADEDGQNRSANGQLRGL